MKWTLAFIMLVLVGSVSATNLGMNYYHETMMKNGNHYISRTTTQVSSDLDTIKTITNSSGNLEWVNQVNTLAKQKGMYTVLVMNTEDRTLDNSNWATYSSKVLDNCKYFNGKVNEFVVGNEISLHSSFSKTDIKNKVATLIGQCKSSFSNDVSYEAFWYEKDAWKGYTGKLYFNMYENLNSFTTNVKELKASFPGGSIGEWGEDLKDEGVLRDENWQKQEVQRRFDVVKATNVPIAYIFTYKEPSTTGFGLVRNDDSKRPVWFLFTSSTPVPSPTPTPSPGTYTVTLPPSGDCQTKTYGSSSVKTCDKGNKVYEMYLLSGTSKVCYNSICVGQDASYAKFTASGTVTPTPTPTPTPSPTTVLPSGGCGTYSNSAGTKVMICDKGSGWYEMYLQTLGSVNYCYKTSCVGKDSGFARFTK